MNRPIYLIFAASVALMLAGAVTLLANLSPVFFLTLAASLFCLVMGGKVIQDHLSLRTPTQSLLSIIQQLLKTKKQEIIMVLPVRASGHLNAATHIGGLLNQFGREAIVIDIDLCHRLLSRKIPFDHPNGVYDHLLNAGMKKPYLDPLSGAKVIPLETSLEADKVVEFSQIMQRLPRLWERWPSSVIVLDLSQWHETYHQALSHVSQVIFYVPPGYSADTFLPKIFRKKYRVPVSLVEIQPD
jgi:hypothetical protein